MISLNGHTLTIQEVWVVSALEAPCALAAEARPSIRRSREWVAKKN